MKSLLIVTKKGNIIKIPISKLNRIEGLAGGINLEDNDEVVSVVVVNEHFKVQD